MVLYILTFTFLDSRRDYKRKYINLIGGRNLKSAFLWNEPFHTEKNKVWQNERPWTYP
jgi:hypothetical protein